MSTKEIERIEILEKEQEVLRSELEEWKNLADKLRLSYGNSLYREREESQVLLWAYNTILHKREEIELLTHMAERSNGLSCMSSYSSIAKIKLEVDFLSFFVSSVKKQGYENTYNILARRSDMHKSSSLDDSKWKSPTQKDEEYRNQVESALLEEIKFNCSIAGRGASSKLKEDLLKENGGVEFIKKYADRWSW